MRAGRRAAVGVVTEGVDVHPTLGIGIVAGDVPADLGRSRLGVLLEHNGARDLGVTANNADWARLESALTNRASGTDRCRAAAQ